ncbi:hypothetical protein KAX02_08190 [candidate division WOR-3 bacterium]|nr:hypothetical protein [candidate division WOR-3 bacterium]
MTNEQASLESKFGSQYCPNAEKFVMTEPLKRCTECKKFKTYSNFNKLKGGKSGLNPMCKECEVDYRREYYIEHRDEVLVKKDEYRLRHKEEILKYTASHKEDIKEQNFLRRHDKRTVSGYYYGQGVCLICGDIHPLVLNNHHVLPKEDMVVSLCSNCHKMYYAGKYSDKHMIAVLNAIENSKFLWDSDGQPKGLKPVLMWTADLSLKGAIDILKSYDLPGYEPIKLEIREEMAVRKLERIT